MRVVDNLRRFLEAQLPDVHVGRVRAVLAAVGGLLRGEVLTLSMVGRSTSPGAIEKHQIKRIDRLLGNRTLHAERIAFFAAIARRLCAQGTRPLVVIDWTEATVHRFCVLYAAVAFQGRAVPIYAEAHPMNLLSNTHIEKAFLRRLHQVLPSDCRPVLVMDAGFKTLMWRTILELGWDFVVRIRKRVVLAPGEGPVSPKDWRRSESFYDLVEPEPQDLGIWRVTRKHQLPLRVVLADLRSEEARRPMTNFRRRNAEKCAAQAAHEPWLLVSSLTETAKVITATYAKRMQIEETLRDQKNPRFGWSLEYSGTRSTARLDILLLIGALGSLVAMLVGFAGEHAKLQRHFQANTRTSRRVLSLQSLGRRLLLSMPRQLTSDIQSLFSLLAPNLAWLGT